MLTAILAIVMATNEPQPPAERPWPGGVWTGEGADKGKTFPAGAFKYTRKEDYEAYTKALHSWLVNNVQAQNKLKPTIQHQGYGIPEALAGLKYTLDSKLPRLTATGPLKTYGGTGTITVVCDYLKGTSVSIDVKNLDFATMGDGLNMSIPIRVEGTVGKIEGTITGNTGVFVGSDVKTRGHSIRRLDLTVNYSTGTYVATATTDSGKNTIRGRLRPVR